MFAGLSALQQEWGTPSSQTTQPYSPGHILRDGINVTQAPGYFGVQSGSNFIGVLLCTCALLFGPSAASMAVVAAGKLRRPTHRRAAAMFLATFCACLVVFAWVELITGGQPCYYDSVQPQGYTRGQINGCGGNWLNVVWGTIINVLYLPLAVVALSVAFDPGTSAPPLPLPFHPSWRSPWSSFARAALFSLVAAFLTGCFTFVVDYLDGYQTSQGSYTAGQFSFNANGYALKIWCWSADNCNNSFGFYYKLYPDVVLYFSFLLALLLAGLLTCLIPPLQRLVRRRIRLHAPPPPPPCASSRLPALRPLPHGVTVGELCCALWVLALFVAWGNFWVNGYCQSGCLGSVVGGVVQTKFQCCRVYSETSLCTAQLTTDPTYGCGTSAMRADAAAYGVDPSAFVCTGSSQCATGSGTLQYPIPEYQGEVAARVVGHIANLAFSLLLYPVSKHSPWLTVFGIGFPHALKFHRLMGIVGFLFATLHMFIWYGQWAVQGTLWSNVVTVNFNRISPVNIHWDNWTIMLMQLLWLLTVPALVVAALYRNSPRMYLLFLRLHYFPIIFAVAGMVHAFSNWFYVAPPMLLFYLDHLARVRRKALLPNAINVAVHDDVVKIEFPQLAHYAGQYCYICCPALSPLHLHSMTDWHPFTVASAPAPASHSTFVTIKCTGPGSWTQQLLQHVTMCNRNGLPVPEIWIDGFYGQVPDVTQAKVVVCMAGGIGVTPFASLLQQLLHRCRKPGNSARMPHVQFMWSLRSLSLLQLYQPVIDQCLSADGSATSPFSCTVDLRVHLTAAPSDHCDHSPLHPFVHRGRPDSPGVFQSVADRVAAGELSSSDVLVLACGPQELVDQASELCFKHTFSFYKEEFRM